MDFVTNNFVVISDGKKIPVIPKILTIQRWVQIMNTWEFSDDDGNHQLIYTFFSPLFADDLQYLLRVNHKIKKRKLNILNI